MSTSTAEGTTVTATVVEGEVVASTTGPEGEETSSVKGEVVQITAPEAEVVTSDLSAKQARTLADRIKKGLSGAADLTDRMNKSVEDSANLMAEAFSKRIWLALELPDWESFVNAELGEVRVRLERSVRQSLVYRMSEAAHMSTRAIAPVFGVDQKTVSNDLRQVRRELGTDAPSKVAGTDGKVYDGEAVAAPKARKQKPVEDRFLSLLTKAETMVYDLTDLSTEDGFDQAAGQIARTALADLAKMVDNLRGIQDRLQNGLDMDEAAPQDEAPPAEEETEQG